MTYFLEYQGWCPICEKATQFRALDEWHRDHLLCVNCENGSVPRERALAKALTLFCRNWREMKIHESSPVDRGISRVLRLNCAGYIGSQFFQDVPPGQMSGIYRSEDLENLTFPNDEFDAFVSLDVFEHIFRPEVAIKEIWRTLKPGGFMISTWPISKYQVDAVDRRATLEADGSISHRKPPEYHGNPIDSNGSLVTIDYGYDVHRFIADCADFDVCIMRFADRNHGITGEFTETIVCQKRSP